MAYMSQERKKELAPKIKEIFKKYGVKGSIGVRNHCSLIVTIKKGKLDFFNSLIKACIERNGNDTAVTKNFTEDDFYTTVNHYYYDDYYVGEERKFLEELTEAMNVGNHDRSDIMTDYFDIGWYTEIRIGQWDKPYKVVS